MDAKKENMLHYIAAKYIIGEDIEVSINANDAQIDCLHELLTVSKSLKETLDEQKEIFRRIFNNTPLFLSVEKKFFPMSYERKLVALLLFYKIMSKHGILVNSIYMRKIIEDNSDNLLGLSISRSKQLSSNVTIYFSNLLSGLLDTVYNKMTIPDNAAYLNFSKGEDKYKNFIKIYNYFKNLNL